MHDNQRTKAMFEYFTAGARRAVVVAQEEARKLGHSQISCEHLLLGILADDSEATAHLGGYLLTYREAEQQILAIRPKGETPSHGHIPFTHEARKVLTASLRLAQDYSPPKVDVEHLALALLDAADPVIEGVLSELEVSKELVREDLTDSAREKADARQTTPSSSASSAQTSSQVMLIRLLEDGSVPRSNLVNALTVFARGIDDDIANDIIAILKK